MAENENNGLDLIEFKEGADILHIGIATFNKLVEEKKIPFVQISDKIRMVKKQAVMDYVNNQNQPIKETTIVENKEIFEIQTATQLAGERLKKIQAETRVKLAEHDLESLEQGFKEIEQGKKGLEEERKNLDDDKKQYADMVQECKNHILQSNEHRKLSTEMMKLAEEKVMQATIKEKDTEQKLQKADCLIAILQDCYQYYIVNIIPVINKLALIKKAIYVEAQNWQTNNNLWSLQQYVSGNMDDIILMLENTHDVTVPEELLPPEESSEVAPQVENTEVVEAK